MTHWMTMSSIKDRLKGCRTVRPVPFAGETFHVRSLTLDELAEVDQFAAAVDDVDGQKVARAKALLSRSVCDPQGGAVFAGDEDPDLRAVVTDLLRTLVEEAAKLNGLHAGEPDPGND